MRQTRIESRYRDPGHRAEFGAVGAITGTDRHAALYRLHETGKCMHIDAGRYLFFQGRALQALSAYPSLPAADRVTMHPRGISTTDPVSVLMAVTMAS